MPEWKPRFNNWSIKAKSDRIDSFIDKERIKKSLRQLFESGKTPENISSEDLAKILGVKIAKEKTQANN